jgi:hypothetical protein
VISIRVQGADTLRQQIKGLSDRRLAAAVATALTRTAVAAFETAMDSWKVPMKRAISSSLKRKPAAPITKNRMTSLERSSTGRNAKTQRIESR